MKNPAGPALPRLLFFALAALLLLAGCGTPPSQPAVSAATPTSLSQDAIATAVKELQSTQMSASTPASESTQAPAGTGSQVILSAAEGEQAALLPVLKDLAGKSGWSVETTAELTPAAVSGAKVVLITSLPANLSQLLQAAPQAQFIVVSSETSDQKGANLTVITRRREDEAFIAGYLAELITGRISPIALLPSDSADLNKLQDGYVTGAHYFCGACRLIPNFEQVGPLVAAQPAGSDANTWQSAIAQASKFGADVVYLPAEVSTPALLSFLASQKVRIIGSTPAPSELQAQWAATVSIDLGETIKALWPDLVAGKGGQQVAARVAVTDIQPQWLSAGRQRLLSETRDQLEQGLISPITITP